MKWNFQLKANAVKRHALTAIFAACAIFASAAYAAAPKALYTIAIEEGIANGSVTASKTEQIAANEKITLSITPDNDCELDSLSVTNDATGKAVNLQDNVFKMPKGNVTVKAVFKHLAKTKAKANAVGDVVLNDGTAIAYENVGDMTASQRAKAVAVIFYVGKECSTNGKTRMLGVGLYQVDAPWLAESDENTTTLGKAVLGSKEKVDKLSEDNIGDQLMKGAIRGVSFVNAPMIEPIVCNVKCNTENNFYGQKKAVAVSMNVKVIEDSYEFSGNEDGSRNLELISKFLKSKGLEDDTAPVVGAASYMEQNYPAFYFAKNYKDYKVDKIVSDSKGFSLGNIVGNELGGLMGVSKGDRRVLREPNLGEFYQDGWYLPSLIELFKIYKARDKVNAALAACGGDTFVVEKYGRSWWSASQAKDMTVDGQIVQLAGESSLAFTVNFGEGTRISSQPKTMSAFVCVIREF